MMPLTSIKVKSALPNKGKKIVAADPQNSYFKRDVLKMKENIKRKMAALNTPPVERHCYKVMTESEVMKSTSLFYHLNYRYTMQTAKCLQDHDFCKENITYDNNIITPDNEKLLAIKNKISRAIDDKKT